MSDSLINEIPTAKKAIAITFDDGPNSIYTQQLLDILQEANGKATFFMIGEQMEKCPDVVKEVSAQGHEIGNHTYKHPRLSALSREDCFREIEDTERLIEKLAGFKPAVFRPPYLDYNQNTVQILQQKGYPMIGALNMDAQDWEQPGVDFIYEQSKKHIKNGSILLFHDGYGDRSQSIEAVRKLVVELTSKGCQLVTVSELLREAK
ncbi:polysaccharide deacetylase family protein [Bacillus sp. AK031]